MAIDIKLLERQASTDMLAFAAKAAGYVVDEMNIGITLWVYKVGANKNIDGEFPLFKWSPLTDDGDALRLAAMLDINLEFDGNLLVRAFIPQKYYPNDALFRCTERYENHGGDKCAAMRLAITRAAADIGRAVS